MKIAFYGSSLLSSYWNGAATYYRGLLRDLHARGHDITFYEPDAFDRQQHRDIDPPPYARSVVYPATAEGLRSVLAHAGGADVVVKANGVGVFDDELLAGIVAHAAPHAIKIFWDVDAAATLDETARLLAQACMAIRAMLDPERIVFGGSIGARAPLLDRVRAVLERYMPAPVAVEASALGSRAAIIGGIGLALAQLHDSLLRAAPPRSTAGPALPTP